MKLLLTFIAIPYFIAVSFFANASNKADSILKNAVRTALQRKPPPTDTSTLNKIIALAENYFETYPDSSLHYALTGLALSRKVKYDAGMADSHLQIGINLILKSDYNQAFLHLDTALVLYKKLKDNTGVTECLINKARVHDFLGNYTAAIKLLNQALAIRKAAGNQNEIAGCYAIMGITFDNKGAFAQALDCYFKALAIDLNHEDTLAAADNYCNIGVVMQHLALYDRSLNYTNKALKLWEQLNDKQGISVAALNIGEVLLSTRKYEQAALHLFKAANLFAQLDDQEGVSLARTDIGLYYHYTNKPDSAIHYLNSGYNAALASKIKYNQAYASVGLAQVYNSQKQFAKAYQYSLLTQNLGNQIGSLDTRAKATLQVSIALAGLKQYAAAFSQHRLFTALTDSLKNNESVQRLTSYSLELDFKQRQERLQAANKQKELLYQQKIKEQKSMGLIFAAIIVLTSLLAFSYYRGNRKQQKLNTDLEEKANQITQQKQDLDHLNILKDKLIAILAHDLRAPLSTLRGLLDLIKDESITEAEFLAMVPNVAEKLNATSDFLDTLLFWVNSQVKGDQINTQICQPAKLIEAELKLVTEMAKPKNLQISFNAAQSTLISADPNAFRIVIRNLLINAIKFSKPQGKIEISTALFNNNAILFTVKDYGLGISKNRLSTLFKSKVTSTTGTAAETGTGMGLYFCRDLVENNKGSIWAESQLNEWTLISFTLPGSVENPE